MTVSFWPLQVLMGVESVWKHEMGLECDQQLQRKLRNTDLSDLSCTARKKSGTLKTSQPIRAAECFWPLPDIKGDDLV
jgi:hypothetical protein